MGVRCRLDGSGDLGYLCANPHRQHETNTSAMPLCVSLRLEGSIRIYADPV